MINRRGVLQGGGLIAASVLLTACGGGTGTLAPTTQVLGHTDINPMPRDRVLDGGILRLPLNGLPNNFNPIELDGSTVDVINLSRATLPYPFTATADGGMRLNTDFFTSAELTSRSPQVITYTINPKANWSDGNPITYRDFVAYWQSCNGSNPAYQVAGTVGFSEIVSIVRGVDDRQAVVTFGTPFGEWQALFDPFVPASLTSTPQAFNSAWRDNLAVTAGPFTVASVDRTGQTITLKRDPKWWGIPAKLDQIIYRNIDTAAQPDALANNEIDFFETGSSVDMFRRASTTPGVTVRNAPSRQYNCLILNGSPGSPLANPDVRRAVAQAIDRAEITHRLVGTVDPGARPDGNHIYSAGSTQYRDNSDALPFDRAAANQALDRLGWIRSGPTRRKDGKTLSLHMVSFIADTNIQVAKTVQNQLAQIGVGVAIQQLSGFEITPAITTGNFDIAVFTWQTTTTPLSSMVGVFQTPAGNNVRENYGRIASPQLDALLTEAIAELDDAKRADLGNQIDRLIWQEAHTVVTYPRPGTVAVRSTLANFGAPGLAEKDYINAGFVK